MRRFLRAMPPFHRAAAAILLALACATPAASAAQTAPLRVEAVDARTGEPIVGARVVVGRRSALTDGAGRAALGPLRDGAYELRVTHIGYLPHRASLQLPVGTEARVLLTPQALRLDEVRGGGTGQPRQRTAALQRFYRRVGAGSGTYFTRARIDELNPRRTSDLFRLTPGLLVVENGGEQRVRVQGNAARLEGASPGVRGRVVECPILYFLDGTPIQPLPNGSIDHEIRPGDIEGIEVYRRGTLAPAEFRRTGDNCGIVLIWKRESL